MSLPGLDAALNSALDSSLIEQRVRERDKLQEELRSAIDSIESRLQSIMEPQPSAPANGSTHGDKPRPSLLNQVLEQQNEDLGALISKLLALYQRLHI